MPDALRETLKRGFRERVSWWVTEVSDAVLAALYDRPKSRFTYKRTFKAELIGSCGQALHELKIDEDAEKVVSRFIAGGFLEGYYEEEERIREARKRLR